MLRVEIWNQGNRAEGRSKSNHAIVLHDSYTVRPKYILNLLSLFIHILKFNSECPSYLHFSKQQALLTILPRHIINCHPIFQQQYITLLFNHKTNNVFPIESHQSLRQRGSKPTQSLHSSGRTWFTAWVYQYVKFRPGFIGLLGPVFESRRYRFTKLVEPILICQ